MPSTLLPDGSLICPIPTNAFSLPPYQMVVSWKAIRLRPLPAFKQRIWDFCLSAVNKIQRGCVRRCLSERSSLHSTAGRDTRMASTGFPKAVDCGGLELPWLWPYDTFAEKWTEDKPQHHNQDSSPYLILILCDFDIICKKSCSIYFITAPSSKLTSRIRSPKYCSYPSSFDPPLPSPL